MRELVRPALDSALIYEDHGKDPTHDVSRFVLDLQDTEVFRVGADHPPARITALDQVAAIKTDPRQGYNFVAYKRPSAWSRLFEDATMLEEVA